MKTRTLLKTSAAILMSGIFTAATLAARGPENWNKRPVKPAEKPAVVNMDEHPSGKCDGCKTTRIWTIADRGPAGKGVPGAKVTGSTHSCTGCAGKNSTENGKVNIAMQHSAGCAKLVCCK